MHKMNVFCYAFYTLQYGKQQCKYTYKKFIQVFIRKKYQTKGRFYALQYMKSI